jgi:hypothetical protein
VQLYTSASDCERFENIPESLKPVIQNKWEVFERYDNIATYKRAEWYEPKSESLTYLSEYSVYQNSLVIIQ